MGYMMRIAESIATPRLISVQSTSRTLRTWAGWRVRGENGDGGAGTIAARIPSATGMVAVETSC